MNPTSEPAAGFDPLVSWGCGEHVHEPLIQSTLITTNEDLEFASDLATEYLCSADGLVWTFTIRDDVVFSDGEPLTARDVAFTVNGIIESPASEADLSMVDRAVAVSDTVVELHLNKPYNALLYSLAVLGIVPEHAYGDGYGSHPIGSGRYVLEQWDKGQQVIFSVNPSYYGEKPSMERVVVVFMDEDAALAAVRKGGRSTSPALCHACAPGVRRLRARGVSDGKLPRRVAASPSGGRHQGGGWRYRLRDGQRRDMRYRRAPRRQLRLGPPLDDRARAGRLRQGGVFGG